MSVEREAVVFNLMAVERVSSMDTSLVLICTHSCIHLSGFQTLLLNFFQKYKLSNEFIKQIIRMFSFSSMVIILHMRLLFSRSRLIRTQNKEDFKNSYK